VVGDQRSKFSQVEVAPLGAQTTQPVGAPVQQPVQTAQPVSLSYCIRRLTAFRLIKPHQLYSTIGGVEPQWCLPQLLQYDSVAQGKWLLLTENLCSVVQVVLWLGQKHLRVDTV
jgi:hypothetical protein